MWYPACEICHELIEFPALSKIYSVHSSRGLKTAGEMLPRTDLAYWEAPEPSSCPCPRIGVASCFALAASGS